NSPWEWDEGADEVSPNEPDHNQPWDEDDEPSQMQTQPKTESKQKQEQKSESTPSKKEIIIDEKNKIDGLFNAHLDFLKDYLPNIDIFGIPDGKK
ncbi:hypothetical protein, partial [Mycoplasma sp. 327]